MSVQPPQHQGYQSARIGCRADLIRRYLVRSTCLILRHGTENGRQEYYLGTYVPSMVSLNYGITHHVQRHCLFQPVQRLMLSSSPFSDFFSLCPHTIQSLPATSYPKDTYGVEASKSLQ